MIRVAAQIDLQPASVFTDCAEDVLDARQLYILILLTIDPAASHVEL